MNSNLASRSSRRREENEDSLARRARAEKRKRVAPFVLWQRDNDVCCEFAVRFVLAAKLKGFFVLRSFPADSID